MITLRLSVDPLAIACEASCDAYDYMSMFNFIFNFLFNVIFKYFFIKITGIFIYH